MSTSVQDLPPLEFVVRSKSGITFYRMEKDAKAPVKAEFVTSNNCEGVLWSKNGDICILRETNSVRVIDMETKKERFCLDLPKVVAVSLSPMNNWLTTITPFKQEPNLQVWDMKTGELHYSFTQHSYSRTLWPYVQWDSAEETALFHSGDTITLFDGHDLRNESNMRVIHNCNSTLLVGACIQPTSMVSLSPSVSCPAIVVFTPMKNGEGVLSYYANKTKGEESQFSLQCQRRLLSCNEATCQWNCQGDRAVITVSTEVDSTGVSYYGRNFVYYLFNDFKLRPDYILNIMRMEQSVQDSQFSLDGKYLCSITSSVPATTTLFQTKECKEDGSCGKLNVNTIMWSPHGHLLLLAGFGNLSGEVHLWDNLAKKRILQYKTDYITSCQWTPDSRHLVMGTCFPRMKIDNRLYLYKYNGEILYKEDFDQLYEISIRPVPEGVYPLCPPTPEELATIKKTVQQKAPAKYVPPHLRNRGGGSVPGAASRGGSVPGATSRVNSRATANSRTPKPAPKPANQPKKAPTPQRQLNRPAETAMEGENMKDAIFASVGAAPQPQYILASSLLPTPIVHDEETLTKKLRSLQKKLREIATIKEKWSILNEEQVLKVSREPTILKEVEDIQLKLEALKKKQ